MKPVSGSATPCSGQASKFSEKVVVDCRLYNHLGNERLDIGYKNKNRINISPVVCSQTTAGSRINLVSIIFTSGRPKSLHATVLLQQNCSNKTKDRGKMRVD